MPPVRSPCRFREAPVLPWKRRRPTLRGVTPPSARPKAHKPRASAASAAPSRKRADAIRDIPPVGVRLPRELRDRLDAIVAARNVELAAVGAETSRAALIVMAVREFCDRHAHASAEASR